MNKYLKIVIVIAIVIGVFLLAFLANQKESVDTISYKDYQEIKSDEGFVYYGDTDKADILKEFAKSASIEISILNPDDLSKSEIKSVDLKKETLYLYQDGKEVYSYDGDIVEYKLVKDFMKEGMIDNSYISITVDDYTKIIKEKGYHFMFIGSDSCGYCTQFKDSIKEVLKDNDFNVYYLNVQNLSQSEYETLTATDSYLTENEWRTPINFLYKNGKRIDLVNGYVDSTKLTKFLKENKVI